MVSIYIKNINKYSLSELNVQKLSPLRQKKIKRLSDSRSKLQSLAAGLLLDEYISDKEIKLNKYGKPFCESGLFFNLSHSGDYVILAISDKNDIGCDIEQIRDLDFERMGKIVFAENELSMLKTAKNTADKFFEYWTKKEAFIKCIGEGFSFPVKSLDLSCEKPYVTHNGQKYFFKEYMLSGYKIMLCSRDTEYKRNDLL